MYTIENAGKEEIPSYVKYYKIWKTKNLSFHIPKKDQCGLCSSVTESTEIDSSLKVYDDHIRQKEKTRADKDASKLKASEDKSHVTMAFDLEQVIFLPKSNRLEIFYKRRLSNYNFTLYNLHSKEVWAFVWHECIAGRGTNEIASCLHVYQYL